MEHKLAEDQNGGHLLVACLKNLGAKHAFGVPGESYLAALDGLFDTKENLPFIGSRNEGGGAYMAEAYGKLTGTPGICFVTRGPGATNASIGVHSAMQASTPMLLFIGQVGAELRDREAFQEVDYRAFFSPIAKWAVQINDADRIPEIVSRAWSTAMSGRPGPVVISLPEDMLSAPVTAAACGPIKIAEPAPTIDQISEMGEKLDAAKAPLVIVGGSGWTAQGKADLRNFVEGQGIPCVTAFRYLDLLDNNSPSFAGHAGVGMAASVRNLIDKSDLILAINIRFGEMTTDAYTLFDTPKMKQVLIHSHLGAEELNKIYQADVPLVSGPNQMVAGLNSLAVKPRWADFCQTARADFKAGLIVPAQPSPVDMGVVTQILQDKLDDDAILTNGAGNFAIWLSKHFLFGENQRLLAPQSGAMGYGVPAAVAAKVLDRGRQVVCVAGDGDFQMNCQELGTALQMDAQPIILIVNNGSYGTIRMHQERDFPHRVSGTEIINPDFSALARSYGFHGERVETTAKFADAFDRALASKTGAVLDLNVAVEAITPLKTLTQFQS